MDREGHAFQVAGVGFTRPEYVAGVDRESVHAGAGRAGGQSWGAVSPVASMRPRDRARSTVSAPRGRELAETRYEFLATDDGEKTVIHDYVGSCVGADNNGRVGIQAGCHWRRFGTGLFRGVAKSSTVAFRGGRLRRTACFAQSHRRGPTRISQARRGRFMPPLVDNLGADAGLGEQLEENAVLHPPRR